MKISTLLDQIDLGAVALPEFQRGYVWSRAQVRGLMSSLYRRHPVGSLLTWKAATENAATRGGQQPQQGYVSLLLDGQQRITSLYGVMRGKPPDFFEGNSNAFTDLHFNVLEETFEFYAPVKMKNDKNWVDVTRVFVEGASQVLKDFTSDPDSQETIADIVYRIQRLSDVQEIDFHIEEVSGSDKTLDVVVDIFNRVNSGGTKLSKGDLALAKICAEWPEARSEMHAILSRWSDVGYPEFGLDWLLRNANAIVTGRSQFSFLADKSVEQIKEGLNRAERSVDKALNLIGARLGLDHSRVLGARGAFPVLCRFISDRDFKLKSAEETDLLLYWYVQVTLWGRYAGSVETVINQDLEAMRKAPENPAEGLISALVSWRGDLIVRPVDFVAWSKGARFYPLLYMLIRLQQARDWGNGLELKQQMLGTNASLEVHHIFPKSRLYEAGYDKAAVNTLANYTFLTKETNLAVSDRDPAEYIPEFETRHPGSIKSHWIPLDPNLWKIENYDQFVEVRRELLAEASNKFLNELKSGSPDLGPAYVLNDEKPHITGPSPPPDEEALELLDVQRWLIERGLNRGESDYELIADDGHTLECLLDLAWPSGMQEGLSEPCALLLNEPRETEEAAGRNGFRFFTSSEALKNYVESELLVESEDSAADIASGRP